MLVRRLFFHACMSLLLYVLVNLGRGAETEQQQRLSHKPKGEKVLGAEYGTVSCFVTDSFYGKMAVSEEEFNKRLQWQAD